VVRSFANWPCRTSRATTAFIATIVNPSEPNRSRPGEGSTKPKVNRSETEGREMTQDFPIDLQLGISEEMNAAIDEWRGQQQGLPERAEAVRRLIRRGLDYHPLDGGGCFRGQGYAHPRGGPEQPRDYGPTRK